MASTSHAHPQCGLPTSLCMCTRVLAAQVEQAVASTSCLQHHPSSNDGDVDTTGEPDEWDLESEEEN